MIERLDNNEQVLLLYLAGELPEGDRADVEQMLAGDASLRRMRAELEAYQSAVSDGLARVDELSPLSPSAEAAARRVGRAMRQQLAQPTVAVKTSASEQPRRSWWWLYPTVAAASVAIVAMVWIAHLQAPSGLPAVVPHVDPGRVADDTEPPATTTPAPVPAPTGVASGNANESDDALLLDSLNSSLPNDDSGTSHGSAEEDPKRVAVNDSMPQDEVSQYLLGAAAGRQ